MNSHAKSDITKSTHSISSDQKSGQMHNQKIIDSYDYLANSASTQDCTGLIPSAPQSKAELESYEDVYHYQPPVMKSTHHRKKADSCHPPFVCYSSFSVYYCIAFSANSVVTRSL